MSSDFNGRINWIRTQLYVVFGMIVIFGCEGGDDSGNDGILIPLKVGNSWEREVIVFGSNGNVSDSYSIVESIDDTIQVDEQAWFVNNYGDQYQNRRDGLWMRDDINGEYLMFKYPTRAGDSHTISDGNMRVTTVDGDTTIVVPAGSFSCIRFDVTQLDPYPDGWTDHYFFAIDLGYVKYILETADGHGGYRELARVSLIEYNGGNN